MTTPSHACEPVGLIDIARRLKLRPNTLAVYSSTGKLPKARWVISDRPAWCWEHDIMPWRNGK
jgi:hypothetical protein